LAAGVLATACGRIGYDLELDGVYHLVPDASAERDDAPPAISDARAEDRSQERDSAGDAFDADSASDAAVETSTTNDASDASPGEAGINCPRAFDLTNPTTTPLRGGTTGNPGAESCPAGQAILGFRGLTGTNDVVTQLQTLCGRLAPVEGFAICQVVPVIGETLAVHGDPLATGKPWTMTCPGGQFVAGVRGRAGGAFDQIAIECATVTVSRSGGSYQVSVGAPAAQPAQGGSGGLPFDDPCPAGKIANGTAFRAGAFIDAFSIDCATVTPVP
jgi:hypothetical protein